MTTPIVLKDATIHPVIEQEGPFFKAKDFFTTLSTELFDENRSWLEPTFIDRDGGLMLCIQSFVIKTPHHNILIDSCVGNHKQRPTRPFWNMLNSDRFEKGFAAIGLTVNDIDYVIERTLGSQLIHKPQLLLGRRKGSRPTAFPRLDVGPAP